MEQQKKPTVVYHGSQYLFDVVKPMQAHGQCEAEAQAGIYAAATMEEVIPFAMPFRWYPDSPEGKLRFDSDGIRSFLQYGSIDPNGKGYVYVLPADTFELVDQWEWVSKVPVKPIEVIEVSVKDYWNTITFSEESREIQKKLYGEDSVNSGYVNTVLKYVKEQCEAFKKTAEDHYDFWKEHIGLVYEESMKLAQEYHADMEIVQLGALLHDIAPIIKVGTRADHHESGAKVAREMLTSLGYDHERTERVVLCVLHHRSSKNAQSIEELCVADADILAHFDNMQMIYNSVFRRNKVRLSDAITLAIPSLAKDFNDLSDKTKPVFQPRFQEICDYVTEMLSLEIRLWNAAKTQDVKAFKELVPDTAVMVCGGYRCSGEKYAQIIADFDCKSYEIENFEILYANEDYVQFHYEIVIEVADEKNSDLAGRFHVTTTWNRQDGKWQLLFNMDQRIR